MKKVSRLVLIVISFWLVLNLGSWIVVGWLIGKTIDNDFGFLGKTQNRIAQLQTWLAWYPYLSLGTYRLPYIHPLYELIKTATYTLNEGISFVESLKGLGIPALQGQTSNWQSWEEVFDKLSPLNDSLRELEGRLGNPQAASLTRLVKKQSQYGQVIDSIKTARNLLESFTELEPVLPKILGYEGKRHYVVLTQNNMELWPTGGYLGSYVEFWMDSGAVKDLRAEAIDVPNGQLKGYVESPEPIVKYTHDGGTPGWRLRESNWDPDFPKAMETIEWFFVEGGVEPIDGMVAVNLLPVIDIVEAIGSLELPDYQLTLTAENFYLETQKHTSFDFFKGSTQKRSFLNYTSRQLVDAILINPKKIAFSLAKVIYKNLQTKQILVAMKDKKAHSWFSKQGWDGSLGPIGCLDENEFCLADYLHVNEANLGVNKANCCLERQFTDMVTISDSNTATHNLQLLYINNNPKFTDPPYFWGAKYEAYVRLYVPRGSELKSMTKDGKPLDQELIDFSEEDDKTIFAFLVYVEGKEQNLYEVVYDVDYPNFSYKPTNYQLIIQKQSGIDFIPWKITVTNGSEKDTRDLPVDRDMRLKFDLSP